MDIKTAAALAPIGLSNHTHSRYGTIEKLTISWTRYTPKLNSKRGRFGLRKRSMKKCVITYYLN
jgi:hypothetical protein